MTFFRNKLLLLLAASVVFGCSTKQSPGDIQEFYVGQIVESVLSGERGMIIWAGCCYGKGWRYNVRFNAAQTSTNTKLIGDDGPVSTTHLSVIKHMLPEELKAIK